MNTTETKNSKTMKNDTNTTQQDRKFIKGSILKGLSQIGIPYDKVSGRAFVFRRGKKAN